MAQERLGIDHVPYTLTFENDTPYSLCETFITPETELVPAWRVVETRKRSNHDNGLTHLLRCAEALSMPNIQPALEKMLVLDYIIANTDRHYNNFGFVRNANTLKWCGLAPIYDSGTSLWHDTHVGSVPCKSKPFRATHDEQIKLVRDFSWFDIDTLTGIEDECTEIFSRSKHIDEQRQAALAQAIMNRTKTIG
ncbi:MAG: HipA domain-containing protein [Firmicutes bacterium]|nr:HipA domain-containing protein [Bacillota bacterium]